MKTVKVRVPATIGNLGPGFDVLGMALKVYFSVELSAGSMGKKNNTVLKFEGGGGSPPNKNNLIWKAAARVFKEYGKYPAVCTINSDNGIPLARGLGSSAAAITGALMAANELCGGKLSRDWILNEAAAMEGHPDNAAPAVFGGVCISSMAGGGVEVARLSNGKGLKVVACIPEFEVSTEKARKVFPAGISRKDACLGLRNFTITCIAFMQGDYGLLSEGMKDFLHQPYRKKLVPGMDSVIRAAMNAGAYSAVLSGSGPTVAAICPVKSGKKAGEAMVKAFSRHGKKSRYIIAGVDTNGGIVIPG